jgi:hypothetical protein
METPNPAASSAEFTRREPLERRPKLFWRRLLVLARLAAAVVAAVFVLMTTDIIGSLI